MGIWEIFHIVFATLFTLASVAVVRGVILENSTDRLDKEYGHDILVRALSWEVILGFALIFVDSVVSYDQRATIAEQQSKIIALEARSWTKAQFDAIQEIRGKVSDVGVVWEKGCLECEFLATNMELSLHVAGVQLYEDRTLELPPMIGVSMFLPSNFDSNNDPLWTALKNAKLYPLVIYRRPPNNLPIKTDIRVIFIGEKGMPPESAAYFPPNARDNWTVLPLGKASAFPTPK